MKNEEKENLQNPQIQNNKANANLNYIKSKQILCPKCNEIIFLKFKDYKISLFDCKNEHKLDNILLKEFYENLNINESNISCDKCLNLKKENSYENQYFICLTCKLNLCQECRNNHDISHKIINYDFKTYICHEHNMHYIKYCEQCKLNLCMKCEKKHKKHKNLSYLGDLLIDEEENLIQLNELKGYIKEFHSSVDEIISKLNEVKNNIELYYKIIRNIYNNYSCDNINYQIIKNLHEVNKNNEIIKKDLICIINEDDYLNKFNYIIDIYNKINNIKKKNNDNKSIIFSKSNEIQIFYSNIQNQIDNKLSLHWKNVINKVDSIEILGKRKLEYKIEYLTKFELKNKFYESITNDNFEESNPRYLNHKNSICIPDNYKIPSNYGRGRISFYISKKDNNPYLITANSKHSSSYDFVTELYNVYKLPFDTNLQPKLIKSFNRNDGQSRTLFKYFMNDKNKNEYLIARYYRFDSNEYLGIINITTQNFSVKFIKIQHAPNDILLLFPPNKDNYIVFSTFSVPIQVHLFETGGFIKQFPKSENMNIDRILSWHNKIDKSEYIIYNVSGKIIINNLYENLYSELNINSCYEIIYKSNDVDYLCCYCYNSFEFWNLYTKKLFKLIKNCDFGSDCHFIQWNKKYLMLNDKRVNYIKIIDLKEEIMSGINIPNNSYGCDNIEKINNPKGESLIVFSHQYRECHDGENRIDYRINLWDMC